MRLSVCVHVYHLHYPLLCSWTLWFHILPIVLSVVMHNSVHLNALFLKLWKIIQINEILELYGIYILIFWKITILFSIGFEPDNILAIPIRICFHYIHPTTNFQFIWFVQLSLMEDILLILIWIWIFLVRSDNETFFICCSYLCLFR